ncbi:hypothetical protein IPC1486_13695 [Pseudomonas aeruginosa]|uniref:hypothetical protein n=1 Tax=Pseudomonas aeruginosa TaxID=287 RepID=UPI0009397F1C|nr:hypothetical protein [Pseudomonas aeruginosa]MBG5212152.1 hypothetical protein [Pseudomonas aeruginosa]MDA3400538.1 hypothetical protein [Pseudomonas aeruginosa]MED5005465.1 hypothetical protein [Pseudomonas aeruginosa]TEF26807.1 hypothetical protein IPC1486_13695 [Pseudomonas aeruginosa]TEF32976.1 hypothetical protein IPC1485_12155 [Pseudomonas aeruginosa]
MHTQHIILVATALAALLILIATAYLAGRKDRKNSQQQAVNEALYLCRVSHGQELTALHTDLIKLRTNAQRLQQVIDEQEEEISDQKELRQNIEAEATEKLADWQQRHEEQQAELKRLETELERCITINHRQAETAKLLREQNLAAEELDAIRTASRLLSGHARQFQKTGTTKRNADAEAQQQLAAILQRLAITELASQSAEAEAQEAA